MITSYMLTFSVDPRTDGQACGPFPVLPVCVEGSLEALDESKHL